MGPVSPARHDDVIVDMMTGYSACIEKHWLGVAYGTETEFMWLGSFLVAFGFTFSSLDPLLFLWSTPRIPLCVLYTSTRFPL